MKRIFYAFIAGLALSGLTGCTPDDLNNTSTVLTIGGSILVKIPHPATKISGLVLIATGNTLTICIHLDNGERILRCLDDMGSHIEVIKYTIEQQLTRLTPCQTPVLIHQPEPESTDEPCNG